MAAKLSPAIAQDPPKQLVTRTARVGTDVTNTIRVPHDRFRDQTSDWYVTSPPMPELLQGNEVKYYVDAPAAFSDMVAAMRTTSQSGHFIYFINWFCDVDFELLNDEPGVNLRAILTQASDRKVTLRAMLWRHPAPIHWNQDNVRFFNSLDRAMSVQGPVDVPAKNPLFNSAAFEDDRANPHIPIPIFSIFPMHVGSQHQKVLCVNGDEGLVCFVGGVDFNPDRIFGKFEQSSFFEDHRIRWKVQEIEGEVEHGQPLHDVHCRITGPAALELVKLFEQKWNDSHFGKKVNADPQRGPLPKVDRPAKAGDKVVQVARTLSRGCYDFAPHGERTNATMLSRAIRNAKRYIYTEDQYFVFSKDSFLNENEDLQQSLIYALKSGGIRHFTAVLTHEDISDMPQVSEHRGDLIKSLVAAGGDRVRIFTLQPNGETKDFKKGKERHTYVHAKIWIIDDEFVSIGTPNSNRRGWSKDNEVAAGIYETSTDAKLHYRLAHCLRTELWGEHLGMDWAGANAELADGVASSVHWLKLPAQARVRQFFDNSDPSVPNVEWDAFVDPE